MDGRLRHRSGELLDVRISARHLVLNGRDYIAAIWSDITASKRGERELRAARLEAERYAAELAAIMDAVPAAIFIAHDPDCRHITGNSVTRKLLRLPPEANISKLSPEGIKPVHFRAFKDGWEIPAEELPLQQAARGVAVTENELDLVFDDGTVRTTLGDARPLFDTEGRPRGAVAVFFDITERKRMERAVREGRDLLAETQKIARIGSWEIDHRLDRLSWSDEIFNLFEIASPGGASGLLLKPLSVEQRDRFRGLIHPEDRTLVENAFDESIRGRAEFSFVHRVLFPDGRVKYVSESARTYFSADGTPLRSLGTVIDLTVRYEAEEALRQNERVLSAIFEGASVGICYADADRGIQKANARMSSLLGYSVTELQYLDYRAFTTPEDVAIEEEQIRSIRHGRSGAFVREKRFIRKDGSAFWGNLSLSASRDRANRLVGFVVVVEDITERREARETLRQFNAELEQRVAARSREIQGLLDSIPDTVLICSASGETLSCHTPRGSACPVVIGPCENSNGAGCKNPLLEGIVADTCGRVMQAGTAVVHEFDCEAEAGLVSLEARAAPVGPDRVLILLRDISERKRLEREVRANLERERQLSEMKSQFISVASHEFRTPLAAAVSTAQLLERYGERISADKRSALLSRLDRSLRRLTEIINDVLIVSRVDANRLVVQRVPTDLMQLVREVINEIAEGDRHLHEFSFQNTGPTGMVQADVKLLHHILSNLLGNAVKYSPEGTTVRVALDVGTKDFSVTVADEGIGVPPGEEARIFQPFGRASNVGEIGGTGLGLDIVRRFSEHMGGRIDLLPSARGATFRITIPYTSVELHHGAA
jgi:PAS domain S-box-containing protein